MGVLFWMRNRAKCKLCESIIESFHRHDYVSCECGEISVDGGRDYFRASAKDWGNFLRIDDFDKEIPVKVVEQVPKEMVEDIKPKPQTRKEVLELLESTIKSLQELPPDAMTTPINHYDYVSLLFLLSALFKAEE